MLALELLRFSLTTFSPSQFQIRAEDAPGACCHCNPPSSVIARERISFRLWNRVDNIVQNPPCCLRRKSFPYENQFIANLFRQFLSACILWCAAFSSSAQTLWQDGTGNWFTAGNWTGGVPTAGIGAEVDNGGTAQIAGGGAASASGLLLGNGGTGNVSVNGVSSLAVTNSIAISGASTFSINGGSTVTSSFGGLNNGGIATVNGASSWTMSQTLLIGKRLGSAS